jgi:DNA-binding LytR/AlgR family response regulator
MNNPTAIIVEDEVPQREELIAMLKSAWPELEIVDVCSDGLVAMDAISERKPDVVFVDIRIPGVSGLKVGKHASAETHSLVVFTTAYDHYAVEAFNQRAIDYLLKPINGQRLKDCVDRLKEQLNAGSARTEANVAAADALKTLPVNKVEPLRWIMTSLGDAIRMVAVDDVLFFQSQDKYTRVVTATIDTHIRTPLKELAQGLDENRYWVIHRSAIVRVDAIDKVTRDDSGRLFVKMKNRPESLAVSLAYQHRFKVM